MQMTKKPSGSVEFPKQKERHIVSWSQEEDDILREQIRKHGTENWAIIASKFKEKTTRQCRRRWYTYLNSDFKKGGWSPEEDMLLCEAQRIFGNRWTEIAKVVSGRTDNAVKNRFSTLCKKRAKQEASTKENNASYVNAHNKGVILQDSFRTAGVLEAASSLKKLRSHEKTLPGDCRTMTNQQLTPPFAVLVQNFLNSRYVSSSTHQANSSKKTARDAGNNEFQGTFLKKDDPKIFALMQQAELLSSLAVEVNTENTNQSLENAWKVLHEFLNQTKGEDLLNLKISDVGFQLENFKDLVADLRSGNEGNRTCWRQPDLYNSSPSSSENSTASTLQSSTTGDMAEQIHFKPDAGPQDSMVESQLGHVGKQSVGESEFLRCGTTNQDVLPGDNGPKDYDGTNSAFSSTEFISPLQATPIFGSLAAGIPSPKFSESERQFLLKTLGLESPSMNLSNNPCQPPTCKRALINSL